MLLVEKLINNRCSYAGYFFSEFWGTLTKFRSVQLGVRSWKWRFRATEGLDEGIDSSSEGFPAATAASTWWASLHKLHVPHGSSSSCTWSFEEVLIMYLLLLPEVMLQWPDTSDLFEWTSSSDRFCQNRFWDEQPLVVKIPQPLEGGSGSTMEQVVDDVDSETSVSHAAWWEATTPRVWWRNKLDYSYPAVDRLSVSEEHMECRNLQGWRQWPLFPKVMTFRQISTIRGVQHRCTLLSQCFSGKWGYPKNERKLILEIYTPIFHWTMIVGGMVCIYNYPICISLTSSSIFRGLCCTFYFPKHLFLSMNWWTFSQQIRLMEEILHHLGCAKPCK